jgi:hypothetical protein
LSTIDEPTAADSLTHMIRKHHWWPAFLERCPGWDAQFCYMQQDEIIDFVHKVIWLRVRLPDPLLRWAHATAHVMAVRHATLLAFGGNPYTEAEFERRVVEMVPVVFGKEISAAEEESADLAAMCWASYSPPDRVQSDVV